MGFVHERGLLSRKKAKSPAESSAGLLHFRRIYHVRTQKTAAVIQAGTVLDSATPSSSRAPRLMMSGRREFSQKKGSLQRLPERSGEEIRTLDTAGMNRML